MTTTGALFYLFSAVLLFASFRVITARSTVHAALYLVLAFANASVIWMLLKAEFLAIALVLVYVGAVMVLFLFVVMMLDLDTEKLREGYVRYLPVGLVVAVAMLVQMLSLIGVKARSAAALPDNAAALAAETSNITWLARTLFTKFLLPFEFAALILTVAVIAAVMLTLRKREGVRHQNPGEQTMVKAADRLRMVKMDAVKPERDAASATDAGQARPEAKA